MSSRAEPPRRIGRYVLHAPIAAGGMGAVYLGELRGASGFSRAVAIKVPHPSLVVDREFSSSLLDEARIAARIRHPNVVSILDVDEIDGQLVLVMDYVHGPSLAQLMSSLRKRNEAVPGPIAAAVILDVLRGLHAAHETRDANGSALDIVHRDVSPQNVLVGLDGVARITDFGVAKARDRMQSTTDGALKGKLRYIAPEQLRGTSSNRQADVYAAAVVLWEALTGERLFAAPTEAGVMHEVLYAEVPAPSTRRPGVSPAFDAIVLRGLARESRDRYASAREMALALEECRIAANPLDVASWVEAHAEDSIVQRGKQVASIEATPSTSAEPAALPPVEDATTLGATTTDNARWAPRRWMVAVAMGVAAASGLLAAALLRAPDLSPASVVKKEEPVLVDANAAAATSEDAGMSVAQEDATAPVAGGAIAAVDASTATTSAKPVLRVVRPSPREGAAAKPGCNPPFTRDASGKMIFKRACL